MELLLKNYTQFRFSDQIKMVAFIYIKKIRKQLIEIEQLIELVRYIFSKFTGIENNQPLEVLFPPV